MKLKPAKNIFNPPKHINHASLKPTVPREIFKRKCPSCKHGVLLVQRRADNSLSPLDICILCGQRFIYDDITELRKKDPFNQ